MAARLSDAPWSMEKLVAVIDTAQAKPGKCRPYKKRKGTNSN